ncbi:hypothetical protein [Nocardia transvalensis]|uniref:hypothetical protein n=1 Tax=Nocardia transvalensis TaxID=37333 RepID=UPI00189632DE|nr:hypothetical protein [Nocardia transvalensis]MBF6333488.1 hypothetical protein [Nocardia transvalensis]
MADVSARPGIESPDRAGADPRYEAVVYRTADEGTEINLYVDGRPCEVIEYHIDPLRGYSQRDWDDTRDRDMATASPAARERLAQIYADARPTLLDDEDGA